MKQEGNIYTADEGKLIVRKSDDFIMGVSIDLGSADSIDNYEEREFPQDVIDQYTKDDDEDGSVAPHEPTDEELLAMAKSSKISEINAYDRSGAVNSFTIGGQSMWLTVDERQQLATQISANEAIGRSTMAKWFGGVSYEFPLGTWKQMLVALEVYAGDALNVTESHKAAVMAMDDIANVEAYDITAGYPERLAF